MRQEENHLDLNNLPDDISRDGSKFGSEDGSKSAGYRKKKSSGKDEGGNIYECRFCSLKFCKSQALGGHMNRHRQERETETLNHARQLVFRNDTLAPQGVPSFGYHTTGQMGDPTLYRPIYTPRFFHGGSSPSAAILRPLPLPSQQPPYLYPSPPRVHSNYTTTPYPMNDYYLGHVLDPNNSRSSSGSSSITGNNGSLNPNNHQTINYMARQPPPGDLTAANYTCIGAPVRHDGFPALSTGAVAGRNDGDGSQPRLEASSSLRINRFHDQGF